MSKGTYIHKSFRDRARLAWNVIKPWTLWAATGSENAFEGHERNRYRYRPTLRLTSQDDDLDIGTREGLISEARDLCRKSGIAKRVVNVFPNYVVGSSYVKWLSPNKEWNLRTEESFWNWSQACDYTQRLNLRKMARLAIMSRKRDGDVFFLERVEQGNYTLEAIEADRVGNIIGSLNVDDLGGRIVGGVKLDSAGRPTGYRILARSKYGTFVNPVDVPRQNVIHFTDSGRFDAYRGVTAFATALNDLRDLKETKDAERLKQKLSSKLALVVKNATGSPMAGINPFGADTTRTEQNSVKTEEVGDLAIQYLFNGDDIQAHHSASPGSSWFQLTELLIRDIAIGFDLPVEFVWNMAALTGPAVRMTARQAERTFRNEQDDLDEQFYNRVIGRWLANEIEQGRIEAVEGMELWRVKRPSMAGIDNGRDSIANLNERQAGVMSGGDIAEERGTDIDEVHAEIERESDDKLTRAKRLADKHGVPIGVALSLMGGGAAADMVGASEPQEQDEDEDDEPPQPFQRREEKDDDEQEP